MKYELVGKRMTKFVGLRSKLCSYSKGDCSGDKKAKHTKKCVIKQELKFEDYKNFLEANRFENKINYLQNNRM